MLNATKNTLTAAIIEAADPTRTFIDLKGKSFGKWLIGEINAHRVGDNSTVGHMLQGMRRAPRDLASEAIDAACFDRLVNHAEVEWDDLFEYIGQIEDISNKIITALSAARGWSPHAADIYSHRFTNGIEGDPGQWVNMTTLELVEHIQSADFDATFHAARHAMRQLPFGDDTDPVGFDEMFVKEPRLVLNDEGETLKDDNFFLMVLKRTVQFMERFRPEHVAVLEDDSKWQNCHPGRWLAINERFLKVAVETYDFWKPIVDRRVERAIYAGERLSRTADNQRQEHGGHFTGSESQHAAELQMSIALKEQEDLQDMLETVMAMVERNVGDIPKAMGREVAAYAELDEESGLFLFQNAKDRLKALAQQREEMAAEGRVALSELHKQRRLSAVNALNLHF